MTYKVILKDYKQTYDERMVFTDDELMKTIGLFSCQYFLAFDMIDYLHAYENGKRNSDTLLAYTCVKTTDTSNNGLRGKLAFGKAWFDEKETEVDLWIERM